MAVVPEPEQLSRTKVLIVGRCYFVMLCKTQKTRQYLIRRFVSREDGRQERAANRIGAGIAARPAFNQQFRASR